MNKLEKLVGRRYETLDLLRHDIELLTGRQLNTIFESESERLEGCDLMIDYEFVEMEDVYTLFYLKDMADRYYITEV